MNRFILGVIAAATIAAGASVSAAAAPYASGRGGGGAGPGSALGAYLGRVWAKDQIADMNRLVAIEGHALRESGVIGGGVPGSNFQQRQFACIRVGHRLQC